MQNKIELKATDLLTKAFFYAKENNLNPYKFIKELFNMAGIEIHQDFFCIDHKAYRTEFNIKSGDLLTFDRANTELENNKIYYFGLEWGKYYIEDWGKYDAETNTIISESRKFEVDKIEVIGKLKRYIRDL